MSITKSKFGELNGTDIILYTLTNKSGLTAEILNYGGMLRRLIYKDIDMLLSHNTCEDYLKNEAYFGALIGRNSNRIACSKFTLNSKTYELYPNDGRNNLHGGKAGFDKKIWDARMIDAEEPALVLSITSPDGEEGFPGTAEIKATYTLTNDNQLKIHYEASCDQDTVMNLTNHAYFNLNGHASGNIDGHTLWIDSDFYTPNNDECIPNGEVLSVKGTPFDFNTDANLGERFNSGHEQIEKFGGFDHNIALNGKGYRKVIEAKGDKSGIVMEVYTDQPAVQFYAGNAIDTERICKDGVKYPTHGGFCLETQSFPNGINVSHFPDGFLKKGDKFDSVTSYKFI